MVSVNFQFIIDGAAHRAPTQFIEETDMFL